MDNHFSMIIESHFSVKDRGIVVTGMLRGTIRVGMRVAISLPEGKIDSFVKGIALSSTV